MMLGFEELLRSLQDCVISENEAAENVSRTLRQFLQKLSESSRSGVKRCKERCLEEAVQLLRQLSEAQLSGLENDHLTLLVRLLISTQLQMVGISTACRKVDQMLQHLAKVDHQLVFRETRECFHSVVHSDQILCFEDLQRACMFLEDSTVGREVWRESYMSMLNKVSELLPVALQQESLRDGPLCYITVKVCLQIFQLLSSEVAPLVWDEEQRAPVQKILQTLMAIILGQCCNRDTRLLAGTAVAMLINTASENGAGGAAAWSLLQVSHLEPWLLAVGVLRVQCDPAEKDGVARLAVCRGLLTCCRPHILLSSHEDAPGNRLLLHGLFPLVFTLCEEKLDCHYFAFEVLNLWLKKVKECLADLWKVTRVRLLPDNCTLLQQLIHLIWTNAESPVDGVSETARSAFFLLLDLYEMDCKQFCDTKRALYLTLLERIMKLPWEAKAKYHRLCALLPYLGTDKLLDQCPEISSHLLKCLSTNHLAPCGSELYKSLIQQQRRELCDGSSSHAELDLASHWARRWQSVLHEALTSEVPLLQNNSATQLLPCTFQVFPSAVDHMLASLDPYTPGHLHAWACILSSYRAVTGDSLWALQGSSTLETLQLALGSADDKVRLAALNLLCCCPKTKDTPTPQEMAIMRTFIPQNLNCDSSPFRQHFQAGVKKFLIRIRDGCLAYVRGQKGKKKGESSHSERTQDLLDQGIGFVEWLSQLPYTYLAPGHSYQRKKTALLLLSAVLETCTDTWSPDRKKGQPPANISSLISCARQRGQWDFFCRTKQLVLLSCLEDSTNEIRELAAGLLLRFFPPSFLDDLTEVLHTRTKQLLCSPRVQEAQMGALMMKILLQKSKHQCEGCRLNSRDSNSKAFCMVKVLVKELEEHYLTAKADMMLAAREKPIHGALSALQRCLLETPNSVYDTLDPSLNMEVLGLLENISLLLLGVLYGDPEACASEKDAPPSFCDMGNAISSLIAQTSAGGQAEGEECVLLSEEHSLVLTCCWVSLKEIGIFLGSLVEKILTQSKQPSKCLLTKQDLIKAAEIFKNILLKCRHWGAVEGCCIGFTKFCASLLSSSDPELRDIPAQMLKKGLQVVQCLRSTSVTRRAAGLPMLILCILSAEEASKARPLLAHSMQTLLETARTPLNDDWDQTLDLPQVCAVHTLQALVRSTALGAAILQFASDVAILSLTLLSSPCWAMRNAALQLYSSLCTRMLGQRSTSEEAGPTQHAMSPAAFFFHYPALQPFLLGELRGSAQDLEGPPNEAKLHLKPSLYPILTLLAQLQPGVQDSEETLSDFLPPLLQLSASPIYSVRMMASKALVAMTPPSEYMNILINLTSQLPSPQQQCSHNRLHGQLLQIKAILERALCGNSAPSDDLFEVLSRIIASLWMVTEAQRCPLVRAVYLDVVDALRRFCCETYLSDLSSTLLRHLQTPQQSLQVGMSSFHEKAIHFLCADQQWACKIWENFSSASPDLRLTLVAWVLDGQSLRQTGLKEVVQRVLQANLREALLSRSVEYCRSYLAALVAVMARGDTASSQRVVLLAPLEEPVLLECLDLLLRDLEDQRGGPEFLSQAFSAASLLLSHWPQSSLKISMIQRWCGILECLWAPDVPEVLRIACAEALCVAGAPLMSHTMKEYSTLVPIMIRLINTGLYLLQDQSQEVRIKAACFASVLHHVRRGQSQRNVYLMQVNQALPFLLDVLLEECWDAPGTLEVLMCHLPQSDLRSVLRHASVEGCSSLYEQDEANVFAEPSVMSVHVLPYLLQMAEKYSQSSSLARSLNSWAQDNAAQVVDGLAVCKEVQPAESLTPLWLALLVDPRFHSTLCGLLTRAAFLLRLLKTSNCIQHLCDPLSVNTHLQDVCRLLTQNGVHFPSALTAAVAGELPLQQSAQ
ncbi:thyroid adenoma-associated protein homolog isoform X2 [Pundamilia nyererei]|uniref:Thyroid adenoma-associated protein homolog isoform X2 n=1 Tax=Pundamilia nyererei TaxID=303518 RepID=A0A9Y6JLF3_9CICH|nr:PREDICTED: thyroid adenoma-associated protein homolog isoform X2 [Pundamilia nyererei]